VGEKLLCRHKVSEDVGGGGAPGARAEVPLQPVMKTMVRQAVPLQHMEVHGGAAVQLQPMEDPPPKAGCVPMESPCWIRLLAGPVTLWKEVHTGAGLLAGVVTPPGTHAGAVCS